MGRLGTRTVRTLTVGGFTPGRWAATVGAWTCGIGVVTFTWADGRLVTLK